jgi:dipeptidyl aminopeptidase/acylaminoacyl peptidase
MLNLNQLLRVPHVDTLFDISPDNSKLAFAWNKTGEWQIYELFLAERSGSEVKAQDTHKTSQLTSGSGGKFNPRYSPEGTKLAYVLDMDGSESYHLVVYDPDTNTHTDLTPNSSHALQPNFCWSPDGSQLAFLSDEQGHFSAYIISSSGGEPQLVLDTGHPAWQVEWSPNGGHLAISCEMHGQDYGIFIVDLENGEVTNIDFNAIDPKWSPDGSKLAFHIDLTQEWIDVGAYDLKKKQINWLVKSAGDSQSFAIMETQDNFLELQSRLLDGEKDHVLHVAYAKSDGAFNSITTLITGGWRKYQIGKGIHSGIRFTSDLKRMVTTFSSPSQPVDLWMINVESGEYIQLTNSLPEELSNQEFVMPEEIQYKGMDGKLIPALIFRPKETPAPAVVMIHGGPNWHYSAEWNPIMAYLASKGYLVLCPNYRGSTGYGRKWQYAAQFDMGGVDTRDVVAGAQYLLREGLASKVAVTGRSHGGYLTMTCLTQFPELWCAGSAVVPFTNWFKSHDDSREDLQHWNIENMGDPKKNYERWYNASPYFFLDKIQAPVQMICGGVDPRCPASDSIDTHDKLVELGKSVDFLLYKDEGHAFLKIENIIDSETKRVEFLAKALDQ